MSFKLTVGDDIINNVNSETTRRPSILKNGVTSALVGRSPLDITIEDLKSDKNPDGINMTPEQLETAKADYLREQSLFSSEKGEEDQDDWNRLQFLEYTTRGLAAAKDFTIDDSLDGTEAYRKFQIDHDDVISTAGIDGSRFQKELLGVENTKKVQSLKEELNSSTNEALQELEVIYEHVAKITSKLYSHDIDQNDVLNDAILDKLVLENQIDQRTSSRNSGITSKKGAKGSNNNSNSTNSGNNLVLQATKTPKAFITDINLKTLSPTPEAKTTWRGSTPTTQSNSVSISLEKVEVTMENIKYTPFHGNEETPLPRGLTTQTILKDVIGANASNMKMELTKRLKTISSTKICAVFFGDLFWHYFLQNIREEDKRVPTGTTTITRIYDRLASNYVQMLVQFQLAGSDAFIQSFPDLCAQSLFLTFCGGFPLSTHMFTAEFRRKLFFHVLHQLTGMKPYSTEWERWPIDHLLPSHLKGLEKAGVESGNTGSVSPETGGNEKRATTGISDHSSQSRRRPGRRSKSPIKSNADDFNFEAETAAGNHSGRPSTKSSRIGFKSGEKRPKESSLIGPGPKTNRVVFDTYVNSPLIKHYLSQSRSGDTICKSLRMHITQVEPLTREMIKDRMTYDDFLRKSRQTTRRDYQTIQKQTEDTTKERQRINGARMKEMRKIETLKDKILMKPSETKAMSEQIIEGWMVKMMANANKPTIRPAVAHQTKKMTK